MSRAAGAARLEFGQWSEVAGLLDVVVGSLTGPGPTEFEVTGFDPMFDLARRGRRWSWSPVGDLGGLARFAAALAQAEADAWAEGDGIVATTAYEDRRFLLTDRIAAWAIPWADVAGRCHPDVREPCHRVRDLLLDLGDRFRIAPLLTGSEGLFPPGEDSFGPIARWTPDDLMVLLSGTVVFDATARSLGAADRHLLSEAPREDVRSLFGNAAGRWRTMARNHPGSARLWVDLAARAELTEAALG